MAKAKKITQNINKDAVLLDEPNVNPPRAQWETKHSNYLSCDIGDIVPIYVDEILPNEKRKITMGMISHMTTPVAPIFNAQYTEFRTFWVPHRLSADLLGGYKTRKSPFVKVFGEDNASANSSIIVPLIDQKLPNVTSRLVGDISYATFGTFGGLADCLDMTLPASATGTQRVAFYGKCNFLSMAAYELIYQKGYRNQNREAATDSDLYKFLFDGYNRTGAVTYNDAFHKAQREKDYFTGSQPFTLKASAPIEVGLSGSASVKWSGNNSSFPTLNSANKPIIEATIESTGQLSGDKFHLAEDSGSGVADISNADIKLYADLSSASGVSIESLRLLIKTQELLEKDAIYGSDYCSSLNAHFGTCPISTVIEEPLELKKVTITSQMQAIFQTSSTSSEPTILGQIGANGTTQSGEFEICPLTEFKEHGYLIICAVHKSQNSYDAQYFKPRHIFKKARFDFYTPELNDLGYQSVIGAEFNPSYNGLNDAVSFNEAFAEYRFKFNKVHSFLEPSRTGAFSFWTLAMSNYNDVQSIYKQDVSELNRAINVDNTVAPQFYDAYGFIEYNDKPMSLHSIPGMDGVI